MGKEKGEIRLCACGCGQWLQWNRWRKRWPMYITGHHIGTWESRQRKRTQREGPPPLCSCGCGGSVTLNKSERRWNKYIFGHKAKTLEYREEFRKGAPLCACGCGHFVSWSKTYKRGWNTYIHNHHLHTPEAKAKWAEHGRELWRDPEFRRMQVDTNKARWLDPEFRERWLLSQKRAPNGLETFFDGITPDSIRYIGDGSWWRLLPNGKYKNPDFKVTGRPQVIELFGSYWHRDEDPFVIIEMFHRLGIECLVLWEHDIKRNAEVVLSQVVAFLGER